MDHAEILSAVNILSSDADISIKIRVPMCDGSFMDYPVGNVLIEKNAPPSDDPNRTMILVAEAELPSPESEE